jgi:hypothetical protein
MHFCTLIVCFLIEKVCSNVKIDTNNSKHYSMPYFYAKYKYLSKDLLCLIILRSFPIRFSANFEICQQNLLCYEISFTFFTFGLKNFSHLFIFCCSGIDKNFKRGYNFLCGSI